MGGEMVHKRFEKIRWLDDWGLGMVIDMGPSKYEYTLYYYGPVMTPEEEIELMMDVIDLYPGIEMSDFHIVYLAAWTSIKK